jgi:hypothetical protein
MFAASPSASQTSASASSFPVGFSNESAFRASRSSPSGDSRPEARASAAIVAGVGRALGSSVGDGDRPREVVPVQGLGELDLQLHVEPVRTRQREGAVEQPGCRARVAAPERAPARRAEPIAGGERKLARFLPELCEVAGSFLEVVAEDLVELDQLPAVLLEPGGEAAMESARAAFGSAS